MFDEPRQSAHDLVGKAQARTVVDLIGICAIGAARLDRQLMHEYGQQPRLIHRLKLAEVVNFGLQIHCRRWRSMTGLLGRRHKLYRLGRGHGSHISRLEVK